MLAPKYELVDFVAFSGDSQNTLCCGWTMNAVLVSGQGYSTFHNGYLTRGIPYFPKPSDLLTRYTFWRVKLRIYYFHFPKI